MVNFKLGKNMTLVVAGNTLLISEFMLPVLPTSNGPQAMGNSVRNSSWSHDELVECPHGHDKRGPQKGVKRRDLQ